MPTDTDLDLDISDLTDHLSLIPALRARLAESTAESPITLPELLVLNHRAEDQSLVLSRKAALVYASQEGRCPASVGDAVADTIVVVRVLLVYLSTIMMMLCLDCTRLAHPLTLYLTCASLSGHSDRRDP